MDEVLTEKMIEALLCALAEKRNFKVRINAAAALMTPTKLTNYGKMVPRIHAALAEAVESASEFAIPPAELQYKSQFQEQVFYLLI